MSDLRWCDEGLHAFSANDQRRQQYMNTLTNPVNGAREIYDICGPCFAIRGERSARALNRLGGDDYEGSPADVTKS